MNDVEPEYLEDEKPLVVAFRNGRPHIRAKPITAYRPTKPQLRSRIAFGEAARMAKDKKKTSELPPAAELVRAAMSGRHYGGVRARKQRKWERILELRVRAAVRRAVRKEKKEVITSAAAAGASEGRA